MKTHSFILILLCCITSTITAQQKDSTKFRAPDINKNTISLEELREHKQKVANESPIIYNSEIPPSFVGGDSAMVEFFKNQIKYPRSVRKGKLEGIVVIRFAVLKNGNIDKKSAKILQHFSPDCDKEALRIIHEMPPWNPFIIGGLRLAGYQTIGIYFGNKDMGIAKRLHYKNRTITIEEWENYIFD